MSINNNFAKVKLNVQQDCQKCLSVGFCNYGGEKNKKIMEAVNSVGAKVGEEVRIYVPSKYSLISAFLIFSLPLLFSLIGVMVGIIVFKEEVSQIVGGIAGIIIGIIIVKLIDIRMGKGSKTKPIVINVIKKNSNLFIKNN